MSVFLTNSYPVTSQKGKTVKSKKYFGATPHKDKVLLEEKKRDRGKRTAALAPVSQRTESESRSNS